MTGLGGLRLNPIWEQAPLEIAVNVAVFLGVLLIAGAVVLDFRAYNRQHRGVVRRDRSLVETGSMTVFFVIYYVVVRLRVLEIPVPEPWRTTAVVAGLVLVGAGVAVNLAGRLALRAAWANQIMIYEGHELVTRWPYSLVRHPLYASLIWAFVGGALVYANPLALALTAAVFVPMMHVRAAKEDAALAAHFGGAYETYRRSVGRFVPRIRRTPWTM